MPDPEKTAQPLLLPSSSSGKIASPETPAVENCSLAETLMGECDSGNSLLAAALLGGRFGGLGVAAATAGGLVANAIGRAGERIVGTALNLQKNTSLTLQNTVSGTARIPEFADPFKSLILEVKNVSYLSYTQQINDMAQWAKANNFGPLQLWVREGATISSNVYKAQEQGLLVLRQFTWP